MFYSYFCSHGLLGATPVEADAQGAADGATAADQAKGKVESAAEQSRRILDEEMAKSKATESTVDPATGEPVKPTEEGQEGKKDAAVRLATATIATAVLTAFYW